MQQPSGLKQTIRWPQGTAMAVGSVLGSGILILPALTAQVAGPASIIAWVVMSLLSVPLAMAFARLASRHPDAGGIVAFARMAFGVTAGRVTGWLFLGTIPVGVPIVSLVGANYAGVAFHLTDSAVTWIAAILLLASMALNYRGVEVASWVQVGTVCVIAGLLITSIIAASPHAESSSFHPFLIHGWMSVGVDAVMIFWCFIGWEMIVHLSEEFHNPKRDVPISLSLASIIVGILYTALAAVTIGTQAYGADVGLAPLSVLVGKAFGGVGVKLTSILALLVTFSGLHMNISGFSRMLFAQARNGDFPKVFAQLHPVYKTPRVAIAALIVPFSIVLSVNAVFHPNLGQIIQWPSVIFLVLYIIAMVSALKLLEKRDIGWWAALVSLAVCLALYPFSGWACLYPVVLCGVAIIGLRLTRRRVG